MTPIQRAQFIAEMERRFRMRTPTVDPDYALPSMRVGRSEMCTWTKETLGIEFGLVESVEPELVKELRAMWKRLQREFPEENW